MTEGSIFAVNYDEAGNLLPPDHAAPVVDTALLKDTADAYFETLTQMALEFILAETLLLLEQQVESQLTGDLVNPSPLQAAASANVPAENCVSERSMALLDNVLNLKPSAAVATIESIIMWQSNKPDEWLALGDDKFREEIMALLRNFSRIALCSVSTALLGSGRIADNLTLKVT